MRLWTVLSLAAVVLSTAGLCQAARRVEVYQLPAGTTDATGQDAWKAAEAVGPLAGGAAIQNRELTVLVPAGGQGVLVIGRAGGDASAAPAPCSFQLALLTGAGEKASAAGPIDKVELVRLDGMGATVRFSAGSAGAEVSLSAGQPFVKVEPAAGGGSLEVRARSRYAMLPDFFADDVIYDATRFKSDLLAVPAENFLVQFAAGGDAMLMSVWQGSLSGPTTRPAAAGDESLDEPRVDLVLAGAGAERAVTATRIEFYKRQPVYVAALRHKGLWHDETVADWPAQKPTALDWKRPFDAKWRADYLVADGKASRDLTTRCQSCAVKYPTDWAKWRGEVPTVSLQGLWPYFIYPAWFAKDGRTWLACYADMVERKKAERVNTLEQRAAAAAKKEGKEYAPKPQVYPPNVYDAALLYPLDRVEQTPRDVFTIVDVMRNTLGEGPCEYVLDLEGAKGTDPGGGGRKLLAGATCALWMEHIFPLNNKIKKSADGKFVPLAEADRTRLAQAMDDSIYFVHVVRGRVDSYRKFAEAIVALCDSPEGKAEVNKPLADAIRPQAESLIKLCNRFTPEPLKKWDDDVAAWIKEVKADDYTHVRDMGKIRGFAEQQDVAICTMRRAAKSIRQEAGLQDSHDPALIAFAARVRELCHQAMRNRHPMEGW